LSIDFRIIAAMPRQAVDRPRLRRHRNQAVYRSISRLLRAYNRRLVDELHRRGFEDFSPAFPPLLSNLDAAGSHIGTLARRAGVTRQAAGQLLRQIESCGYVDCLDSPNDTRATLVAFTARGRALLANVLDIVADLDREYAEALGTAAFDEVRDRLFAMAEKADPGGALVGGE
jgi:DNA-binding MarR family transcriptional regulator